MYKLHLRLVQVIQVKLQLLLGLHPNQQLVQSVYLPVQQLEVPVALCPCKLVPAHSLLVPFKSLPVHRIRWLVVVYLLQAAKELLKVVLLPSLEVRVPHQRVVRPYSYQVCQMLNRLELSVFPPQWVTFRVVRYCFPLENQQMVNLVALHCQQERAI